MPNSDLLLYAVHGLFWGAFVLMRLRTAARTQAPPAGQQAAPTAVTAPWSRALVALHGVAFGIMYFGIGNAVIPNRVPTVFALQRPLGAAVIAAGGALCCWALAWFSSWRLRARLDAGHRLATGGPFRFMRHPIYTGLDLLALGSALWVPTPLLWAGLVLMVAGGALRARSEERVLAAAFGSAWHDYAARTRRFIPGLY